jgi:AcrR family transcriptional regulator
MRYPNHHKISARARLIETTGAHAKKNGFASTGVDGLMAAAGLTSGAFYGHFRSKNELLEAIVEKELARSIALFSDRSVAGALEVIEGYLSEAHVDHPEAGCAVPALATEVARAGESTHRIFEAGMRDLKEQFVQLGVGERQAWSILAQLTGAVMIARGLHSAQAKRELLDGVLQQVRETLQSTPGKTRPV